MSSNLSRLSTGLDLPAGAASVSYLTFMGAGVIALTTLFTSLFGGITLLFDKNWGLMRELLASPMPRNHIILGIGLSGVTKSFIQVMVIMGFVMYFIMIRPQMKRQKEHKAMIDALAKGDEVVTGGGLVGKIIKVGDNYVTLEIAEGTEVIVQKPAIGLVLPKGTLKSL